MTHPAFFSVEDSIGALNVALRNENLSIIHRRILQDMKADLEGAADFDTFQELVQAANSAARKGAW